MRCYTVSQIADMLDTNPETVRRWIRSGKLKAQQGSRKSGNLVHENALQEFLQATPKYAGKATSILTGPQTISMAILRGLVAQKHMAKESYSESEAWTKGIKNFIAAEKVAKQASITEKQRIIAQLQHEILDEQAKVKELDMLINELDCFLGDEPPLVSKDEDQNENSEKRDSLQSLR